MGCGWAPQEEAFPALPRNAGQTHASHANVELASRARMSTPRSLNPPPLNCAFRTSHCCTPPLYTPRPSFLTPHPSFLTPHPSLVHTSHSCATTPPCRGDARPCVAPPLRPAAAGLLRVPHPHHGAAGRAVHPPPRLIPAVGRGCNGLAHPSELGPSGGCPCGHRPALSNRALTQRVGASPRRLPARASGCTHRGVLLHVFCASAPAPRAAPKVSCVLLNGLAEPEHPPSTVPPPALVIRI